MTTHCTKCGAPLRARRRPGGKVSMQCSACNAAAVARWTKRNPEKKLAHVRVAGAVKRGHLVPRPCEVCGSPDSQAHHDDYGRPLDVRWLCRRHHAELHATMRRS